MKKEKLKSLSARPSTVKIIGNTIYEDSTLWLIHSASGLEFDIEAKCLYFNLVGDETARPSSREGETEMNWARYQIFIDGKTLPPSSMDRPEKSVCAFDGEEKRRVRVQLLKLTEGSQSFMGIRDIQLDEEGVIKPVPDKKTLIEFIGDSITCGYGVEGKSAEEPFTTQTENALKAYAWLTAQKLDADCTLTSFSGFGIVSGWTDSGDLNSIQLVPRHYRKFAFSWNSKKFIDAERDFSGHKPDVIVINLGTNDDSYTRDIEERQAQYASEYVKFIKEVRSENPDAHLILCLGIMLGGLRLLPWMDKAAADYRAETGDERISTLHFRPQTPEEGFGCDYHPSQATQIRSAEELSDFIRKVAAQKAENLL